MVDIKSKNGMPIYQPNKQRDITGKKFGNLTALFFEYRDERHRHFWRFRCDCGKEIIVRKSSVTSGNTKRCIDCSKKIIAEINTVHGMSKTRLYKEWAGIIQRCKNPNATSYDRYGAKGITVCQEWPSFDLFKEWALNNGYSDELTIERINNNKGYSPDNCKWATYEEQAHNQKTNRNLEYNGRTMTMAEWAREIGITSSSLYGRLKRGWGIDKALSTPPIKK